MPDEPSTDADREAILARRKRFTTRALGELARPLAASRTKVIALTVSGLTTACPCLKMAPPPDESEAGGEQQEQDGGTLEGTGETSADAGGTSDGTGDGG